MNTVEIEAGPNSSSSHPQSLSLSVDERVDIPSQAPLLEQSNPLPRSIKDPQQSSSESSSKQALNSSNLVQHSEQDPQADLSSDDSSSEANTDFGNVTVIPFPLSQSSPAQQPADQNTSPTAEQHQSVVSECTTGIQQMILSRGGGGGEHHTMIQQKQSLTQNLKAQILPGLKLPELPMSLEQERQEKQLQEQKSEKGCENPKKHSEESQSSSSSDGEDDEDDDDGKQLTQDAESESNEGDDDGKGQKRGFEDDYMESGEENSESSGSARSSSQNGMMPDDTNSAGMQLMRQIVKAKESMEGQMKGKMESRDSDQSSTSSNRDGLEGGRGSSEEQANEDSSDSSQETEDKNDLKLKKKAMKGQESEDNSEQNESDSESDSNSEDSDQEDEQSSGDSVDGSEEHQKMLAKARSYTESKSKGSKKGEDNDSLRSKIRKTLRRQQEKEDSSDSDDSNDQEEDLSKDAKVLEQLKMLDKLDAEESRRLKEAQAKLKQQKQSKQLNGDKQLQKIDQYRGVDDSDDSDSSEENEGISSANNRSASLRGGLQNQVFDDEDDDDDLMEEMDPEKLNALIKSKFGRSNPSEKQTQSRSKYLFEEEDDDDDFDGFDDISEQMQDTDQYIRQKLFAMDEEDDNMIEDESFIVDDDDDDMEISQPFSTFRSLLSLDSRPLTRQGANKNLFSFQNQQKRISCQLPSPTRDNLDQISAQIKTNLQTQMKKNSLLSFLQEGQSRYLADLSHVFNQLDEKRIEEVKDGVDNESLNSERILQMGQLFKTLLLIGDAGLIKQLLSDRFYQTTFGSIEQLPEFKQKLDIRDFFAKTVFKKVIPFDNPQIDSKIKLCYRLIFIRDTIFPNTEGMIQQQLACLCINTSIEILHSIINNVEFLKKIVHSMHSGNLMERRTDAVQFIMEILISYKSQQQYLMTVANKTTNIAELMLRKLKILDVVQSFFQEDVRVKANQKKLFTDIGVEMETPPERTPEPPDFETESAKSGKSEDITTPSQFKITHSRFKDKACYDIILTQCVELMNILLQTSNKEFIICFSQCKGLSTILGQHVFFTQEDMLSSQIVELFKTILDLSGQQETQCQIERIIESSILKPFMMIVQNLRQQQQIQNLEKIQETEIEPLFVTKEFSNQFNYIFELLQLMVKPLINALMPDPRKSITYITSRFLLESNIINDALSIFSCQKNSVLTRLMALKFFKSLFCLKDQTPKSNPNNITVTNREIIKKLIKSEPILYCIPTIETCRQKNSHLMQQGVQNSSEVSNEKTTSNLMNFNMLDSAMFEMINQFGAVLYSDSPDLHAEAVIANEQLFSWCPNLFSKFVRPDALVKKQEMLAKQAAQQSRQASWGRKNILVDRQQKLADKYLNQANKIANSVRKSQNVQKNSAQNSSKDKENTQNKNQKKNKLSIKDLVMRDFQDETELKQVLRHIGQKRTHAGKVTGSEGQEEFEDASVLQQKRVKLQQNQNFKFKSSQGEKLPSQLQQSKSQDSKLVELTWEDSDEEQRNSQQDKQSLEIEIDTSDNSKRPRYSSMNLQNSDFLKVSDLMNSSNTNQSVNQSQKLTINDVLMNSHFDEREEERISQEENILDLQMLQPEELNQDELDCDLSHNIALLEYPNEPKHLQKFQSQVLHSGESLDKLEIELPLLHPQKSALEIKMHGDYSLPTLGDHLNGHRKNDDVCSVLAQMSDNHNGDDISLRDDDHHHINLLLHFESGCSLNQTKKEKNALLMSFEDDKKQQ